MFFLFLFFLGGGGDGEARVSEIFTKNPESEFFIYKESISNKKKNSGRWEGRGVGVARVSVFFFSKESKSEKKYKKFVFFLRG